MIKIKPSIIIAISFIIISTRIFATSITGLLENQDELFKKLFPTSSFEEFKQFEAAVEQKHPKSVEKILNKAIVVIAAPHKVQPSIFSQGFKNLYQTGTSRGFTNRRERLRVEVSHLNIQFKDYEQTHHSIKPKYGFLTTWKQLAITIQDGFFYGEDFYVLDLEQIQDRITWTPGDSLNRYFKFSSRINYEYHEASCWEQIFIPWKYRLLMIPYLIEPDNGFLSIDRETVTPSIASMNQIFGSCCSQCYIEAQIFGKLNLSHVSALVSSQIPDLKSMQCLSEAKVEVFDGNSMKIIDVKKTIETSGQKLLDIKSKETVKSLIVFQDSFRKVQSKNIHKMLPEIDLLKEAKTIAISNDYGEFILTAGNQIWNPSLERFGDIVSLYEKSHLKIKYGFYTSIETADNIAKIIPFDPNVDNQQLKYTEVFIIPHKKIGTIIAFLSNGKYIVNFKGTLKTIHSSEIAPDNPTAIGRKGKELHLGNQAKAKSKFLKRSKKVGKILKFFPNGKTLVIKNGKKKYVDTNLLSE